MGVTPLSSPQMETALLVALIFLIASGLNRIPGKNFLGAAIRNDGGERIQTLEFSVPALKSKVLFYKAGELQSANPAISGRDIRLWYPPEEVSKKEFLKSLERAPIVVGTHEASTSEHNKKIDGWPIKVFYDAATKSAMIEGVVKGNAEADYVRSLKGSADFGASGFIDARKIEIKEGTTPEGDPYDAIAHDLFATHVALLPNVRDPENKIQTFNARAIIMNAGHIENGKTETTTEIVKGYTITYTTDLDAGTITWIAKTSDRQLGDINGPRIPYREMSKAQSDAREAVRDRNKIFGKNSNGGKMPDRDEKPEDSLENTVRNVISKMEAEKSGAARMDAMEKTLNAIAEKMNNGARNGEGEETEEEKKKKAAESTNTDEGDVLKNAKASEETIKAFADALGLNPASLKNSTVKDLAKFAGVETEGKSPIEVVQMVNAKAKELKGSTGETTEATAKNADVGASQFDALLQRGA